MDGHRRIGRSERTGPTDASFDREIESLLASEPSPEFVARVRARVGDETPRGSWAGWRLTLAVASLGLTVVVAIALWPSKDATVPTRGQARSSAVGRVAPQARTGEPERVQSAAVVESPRIPGTRSTPRATDVVAAERLVPVVNEEDGKAFDAFLARIRSRDVVLTFNESADSALTEAPLVIAPIAINPLPDVLEGGLE